MATTPHTGLDSASSLDILKSLQAMAGTGRAIVVTIHQPRSEIFHAFDKILLLCNGQVAFFGSPVKVWEFFRKALISERELMVRMYVSQIVYEYSGSLVVLVTCNAKLAIWQIMVFIFRVSTNRSVFCMQFLI